MTLRARALTLMDDQSLRAEVKEKYMWEEKVSHFSESCVAEIT